jgi:hypothetical protein
VAEAIGFHSRRVERAEDADVAVRDWLAQPAARHCSMSSPAAWS